MVSIPARSDSKQGFLAKMGEITPEIRGGNTQNFPVVMGTTEDQEQQSSADAGGTGEQLNKYSYPEFAGYAGERYLDSIVQQILPYSQWRTWHYAVDFQAPGQECYVGPSRLAARVKPQERKIMLDFQRLEQANEYRPSVMHRYPARLPIRQDDGSLKHCAVTVKDFSRLYELAHEYHCWMHGPAYIPAEREYAELIMENPELAAWLCRFDNYRRVLLCRKPGRKPTRQQQDSQLTAAQVAAIHQQTNTNVLNVNQYFNASDKTDSAYRIPVTDQEQQRIKVSNDSTSLEGKEVVAAQTIRNSKEDITVEKMFEYCNEEETYSNPNKENQEEEAGPEQHKQTHNPKSSQEKAAAALAHIIPVHHWQKLHGGQPQAAAPKRIRRTVPAHLENNIKALSAEMGDSPQFWKSNVTRAFKLYVTARQVYGSKKFSTRKFYGLVTQARDQAREKCNIEHTDESGQAVNRMPYWFTCFETLLQLNSIEILYARSQEPLYEDGHIKDYVIWYRQQRQTASHAPSES